MSEYHNRACLNYKKLRLKSRGQIADGLISCELDNGYRNVIRDLYRQISLTEGYYVNLSREYTPDFEGLNDRLKMRMSRKMLKMLSNLFNFNYMVSAMDIPEIQCACRYLSSIATELYNKSKIYCILDVDEARDRYLSFINRAVKAYKEDPTYKGLDKGIEFLCLALLSAKVNKDYYYSCNYNAYKDPVELAKQYNLHSYLPEPYFKYIKEVHSMCMFSSVERGVSKKHKDSFNKLIKWVEFACEFDLQAGVKEGIGSMVLSTNTA